ncbi:hypothetical protein [Streptomyces kronopolitis]|uniref:hypothetical protein n=1 Tax=Streptomyces kronopolitis TaxID=1612435 RepID=UPI003418C2D9
MAAAAALAVLWGRRIVDLVEERLEERPWLSAEEAAERLGCPPITHRRALIAAHSEQRIGGVRLYVLGVVQELAGAGMTEPGRPDGVERSSGAPAAVIRLASRQEAAAVV